MLQSFFVSAASLVAGLLVTACNSNPPATKNNDSSRPQKDNQPGGTKGQQTDSAGVTQSDLEKRKQLGYVEKSPIAESHCSNCALYLPPKAGEKLGNCQLFKGHVLPEAYCTYWAAPQQ